MSTFLAAVSLDRLRQTQDGMWAKSRRWRMRMRPRETGAHQEPPWDIITLFDFPAPISTTNAIAAAVILAPVERLPPPSFA